jgi:hypothetical protein
MKGELTQQERDAMCRCGICGTWRYTPSMARQCERRCAELAGLCTPGATIASRQDDDCE